MAKKSFNKGYDNLKRIDQPVVRDQIMALLKITTTAAFYQRKQGKPAPRTDEAEGIENIFINFGIKKSQIWD